MIFNQHFVDVAERHVRKGVHLELEGQIATRKWTDKNGVEKYSTEIVLPRFKGELEVLEKRDGKSDSQGHGQGDSGYGGGGIDEDSIPFGPSVL